tara:strand:- start:1412 stop:1816 length:405 start_codon:yes stop_codon:yes gene_type:complete
MAKFYNIANLIDKNYNNNNYLSIDDSDVDNNLSNYLIEHKEINTGDILFIGSTYETRQCYGFVIVDKRNGIRWINSEQGIDLPFEESEFKNYLSKNKIKYKELFNSLPKYFSELSGYNYEKEEVAEDYLKNGIW